jgi:glutamine synthetase
LNPREEEAPRGIDGRQTVELRSPDGSAMVHLLLAGIVMAAEWGLSHEESLDTADKLHVTRNIIRDKAQLDQFPALPQSCFESAGILLEKRHFYERENIFPSSVVQYVAESLVSEKDENLREHLASLPADDRIREIHTIMHKDLHRQ